MRRKVHSTDDYILLSLPENPRIFAVERKAHGQERFVKKDPEGAELGIVYQSMLHIISPYYNYYTGEATESCSCLSWRTRRTRCVHLRKFFEMNPQEDPRNKGNQESHDIYEETVLHPGILSDRVCDELYPEIPDPRTLLGSALENRAVQEYKNKPEFREQLASCLNSSKDPHPEKAREWLLNTMRQWAQDAIKNLKAKGAN